MRPNDSHLTAITTFRADPNGSPEENLIDALDVIDLHHGTLSSNPRYDCIEVFGVALSQAIRRALAEYGFTMSG
jgi:hypothetical protein